MLDPIARLSRLLSHLRWLFMPLGLFALVAVGVHAGASVAHDAALVSLDWLDGLFDRAAGTAVPNLGNMLGASPETVDRWLLRVMTVVDMREREVVARWVAVAAELATDVLLALPALGYRERRAEEVAREASRQKRLAELVAQRLSELRPGSRPPVPVPAGGTLKVLLRSAVLDPTLLRLAFPLATACVAVAGACRIAIEMQTLAFAGLAHLFSAGLAGDLGRGVALFVLLAVLVSLGCRAVLQSLWWAHGRAERARHAGKRPLRRRLDGWLRVAIAVPLAAAAALDGAPLLSFFR